MENPGLLILALALSALAGYLLGSVNFAIPVCKLMYGQDVRTMGSGNAGMTNVLRSFGKKGAALTMAGDTAKGLAGVLLGRLLVTLLAPGAHPLYGAYIGGIAAIVGHTLPLYFGFKGGKGVATSLGVIIAIQPVLAAILLGIFLLLLGISKMVSFGSVLGILCYPPLTAAWYWLWPASTLPQRIYGTVCATVITGLVVWMHRENIRRILNGSEYKFGQEKQK